MIAEWIAKKQRQKQYQLKQHPAARSSENSGEKKLKQKEQQRQLQQKKLAARNRIAEMIDEESLQQ